MGFPVAILDEVDIEDESPQGLPARAEREGLDLRDFTVDDDWQCDRVAALLSLGGVWSIIRRSVCAKMHDKPSRILCLLGPRSCA